MIFVSYSIVLQCRTIIGMCCDFFCARVLLRNLKHAFCKNIKKLFSVRHLRWCRSERQKIIRCFSEKRKKKHFPLFSKRTAEKHFFLLFFSKKKWIFLSFSKTTAGFFSAVHTCTIVNTASRLNFCIEFEVQLLNRRCVLHYKRIRNKIGSTCRKCICNMVSIEDRHFNPSN